MNDRLEHLRGEILYRIAVSKKEENQALEFSTLTAGQIMRKLAREISTLSSIIPIKPDQQDIIFTFAELAQRKILPSLDATQATRYKDRLANPVIYAHKTFNTVGKSQNRTIFWYGALTFLQELPLPIFTYFRKDAQNKPDMSCLLFPEFVSSSEQINRSYLNADHAPPLFSVLSSGQRIDMHWLGFNMSLRYFGPIHMEKDARNFHLWVTSIARFSPKGNDRVRKLEPAPTPVGVHI